MNRVLRESARLVVAAVLIVSIGSVGTVLADGDEPVAVELHAPRTVVIGEVDPSLEKAVQLELLDDNLQLTSGLVDVPNMPEEMELFSDIVTELLSGNVTKFLADNATRLLSGNVAELLSGNEPELLSGNEAELLSENDTRILSGNKPELLSGNQVELFSNVNVNISITNSGNTNGAPPAVARQPFLLQQKKAARPPAVHDHGHGTAKPQSHKTTKSAKKARRAKRRFAALDANGDGVLSFEEMQGRGTTDHTVAASERR